jgi:signal transduction histidine kinase
MRAVLTSAPAPSSRHRKADLDGLAVAAQRALGSDAVVIVSSSPVRAGSSQPRTRTAAADGLPEGTLEDLQRGLTQLDGALDLSGRDLLSIPFLAGTRLAGAKIILSHGFAAVLCAPVELDDQRVGTIYALKREPGRFVNEVLISTFARQAAIATGNRRLHRRSASLAGRLQGLAALDELVLSAHNFNELSRAINETVAPIFGVAKTGIMIWDERREVLQMIAGSFGAKEENTLSCQVNVLDSHSNSARVFTTGRAYISNHAEGDAGIMQEYVDAFEIDRLLSVPLTMAGRPIGVLHLANKQEDFVVEDLQRAEALTPRIAGVVELARTLFRLRRQQRLEEILSRVAVAIASGEGVKDFLTAALAELGEAVEATFMAMVPAEGQPALWRKSASPLEEVVLAEVRGRPGMRAYVVGPQKAGDPGWAVFYAPVHLGGQRVGTLAALRTRGEPFAQEERRAIVRLAGLAALSFATERYQQQRAELARLQERQRIADDLHDDVAQILFAAQLNLDAILEREQVDDLTAAGIARALGLLIRGDTAIRKVIHQLSSPGTADFGQRLAAVVVSVEQEFSLAIHLRLQQPSVPVANRLRKPAAEALLKVARESLVNAAKHAGPCRVSVLLELTDRGRLLLSVVDDGVGANGAPSDRGHGLTSLRRTVDEHGGCLRIGRGPAGGTKVTASLPVPVAEDSSGAHAVAGVQA